MPNPNFSPLPRSKDTYERVFGAFENEMHRLGISDYNEGLKRVFEEWSSRYKGSTLSTN